jgi:hypothetical protein
VNTPHFHYEKITAVEIIIIFVNVIQEIQLHSVDTKVSEFYNRWSIYKHYSLKGKEIDQGAGDEVIIRFTVCSDSTVTLSHRKFDISLVLKEYCASTVYYT